MARNARDVEEEMLALFWKMVDRLMLEQPLKVYLAGGMAVHLCFCGGMLKLNIRDAVALAREVEASR